jgi:hypothetical protein
MRMTTARLGIAAALVAVVACGKDDGLQRGTAGGTTPAGERREEARRPSMLKLSPGAQLDLRSETSISSRRQRVGTLVAGVSTEPAVNGNGDTVIPAGARFTGRVTSIAPAETPSAQGRFAILIDQVSFNGNSYPVEVEIQQLGTQRVGRGVTTGDAGKVAGGAVIGGVAGRVIGGNARGTIIGGAVGAAAGGVYANQTRDVDIRLPEGGLIKIAFLRPFEIRANQVAQQN